MSIKNRPSPIHPLTPLTLPLTAYSSLPAPLHHPISSYNDSPSGSNLPDLSLLPKRGSHIPAYGKRKGWKPKSDEDFGDGGAYPECWVAQYPLDMGRKKVRLAHSTPSREFSRASSCDTSADPVALLHPFWFGLVCVSSFVALTSTGQDRRNARSPGRWAGEREVRCHRSVRSKRGSDGAQQRSR